MAHVFRAIRLPLYFFLSGCFFKQYNGFFDFLKRKTNKLLIPFVFWFLFVSVIIAYIYGQLGIPVFTRHPISPLYSFRKLYHETNFVNLPIWFLLCLFEINIIFYLIHSLAYKFFKRRQTLAICLLSMMLGAVGLLFFRQNINLPFYLDRALESTPFFAFGYVCFRHHTRLSRTIPLLLCPSRKRPRPHSRRYIQLPIISYQRLCRRNIHYPFIQMDTIHPRCPLVGQILHHDTHTSRSFLLTHRTNIQALPSFHRPALDGIANNPRAHHVVLFRRHTHLQTFLPTRHRAERHSTLTVPLLTTKSSPP